MGIIKHWNSATVIACFVFISSYAQANGIEDITIEGTGCSAASVAKSVSNDHQSMTLIFDSFVAYTGPDLPGSEEVKECRIDLTMQNDDSVGIVMDTRGYVQLSGGMTGDQHQNIPRAKRSNQITNFFGPVAKDYLSHSTATVLAQGNPSSRTVSILLQIAVDKGNNLTGQSQITIDSLDLKLN
jgi:hypothetical protein